MNKTIRIVSDVHGKLLLYRQIISEVSHSVCLGDVSFNYSSLMDLYHSRHLIGKGNHDNGDTIYDYPGCLPDYGYYTLNDVSFYHIFGAFSVDKDYRQSYEKQTTIKIWWPDEQIDEDKHDEIFQEYMKIKPNIMLSHSCPISISRIFGNPNVLKSFGFDPDTFESNTQRLLEKCFSAWQPKLWCFGHLHLNKDRVIDGTRFICRKELGFTDINNEGEVI